MKLEELGLKANKLIMNTALKGLNEGIGPMTINWYVIGKYLLAYVEELEAKVDYFRVFRCNGPAYYERKLVLHPSYRSEEYMCVYDSKETAKGRTITHSSDEVWMDEVEREIRN